MVGSFKDKFLTVKKMAAEIQEEHGCSADVIVMVKNNPQDPGNKNSAPSAGKYLVYVVQKGRMLADFSTMKKEKIEEKINVSESCKTSDKKDDEDSIKVSEGDSKVKVSKVSM